MPDLMPGPICVKLSGVAGVWWESDLGQKINFSLPHLCMRDDSLGFEDCRLATHLLNFVPFVCFLGTPHPLQTSYMEAPLEARRNESK